MVARRTWLTVAVTAALAIAAAAMALADGRAGPIRPDGTFGGGRGWVTTVIPGGTSQAYDVLPVQGGRIVAVGQVIPPPVNGQPPSQIIVLRYLPSGRLDRSFGSGGIFKTALPTANGPYNATSVAADSAGRLIVAGGDGKGGMLALRLTPNGRLDRTLWAHRSGGASVAGRGFAQSGA